MRNIATIILLACCLTAFSQQEESGAVMRKGKKEKKEKTGATITPRMQSFYETHGADLADLDWMRVIYRSLDLTKEENMCLYFPEEPNEDGQDLFFILMRALAAGEITAYEYLDGKEIFTDQYKIKVGEMLDRFHIMYSKAKGSTEKNPKYTIEDADIPANMVLSYYIVERYEFDRRESRVSRYVQAICPVLHETDYYGGDAVKYPMFWVKMSDIRPLLAQQYVFTSNDNNVAKLNLDDYFVRNMYKGDIYKFKNLRNLSMAQMFPDPERLKFAQDSIEARLASQDKNLWVPNREDLIAAAEAREIAAALAAGDSTVLEKAEADKNVKKSSSRSKSKRGSSKSSDKKKTKVKSKATKPKATSSSATKSVRRRKK